MNYRLSIIVVSLFCILFSYPAILFAQGSNDMPQELLDALADDLGVDVSNLNISNIDVSTLESPGVVGSSGVVTTSTTNIVTPDIYTGVNNESNEALGIELSSDSGSSYMSGFSSSEGSIEDFDGDTMPDEKDNCSNLYNKDQLDSDSDGIGDECDETPYRDHDKDGVPDAIDNCLYSYNPDQLDSNGDNQGDVCTKSIKDFDADTVMDLLDNCPYTYNPDQIDINENGVGDECESNTDLRFMKEPTFKLEED